MIKVKSCDKRPFLIQSNSAVHFSYIRSLNFYLFFLALSAKNVWDHHIWAARTLVIQNKHWIASSHLAVHVHDDHRAGVVANQKLFWILREGNHVVDGHLRCSRQRLVSVEALPRFRIPNLQCDIKNTIHTRLSIGAADTTETHGAPSLHVPSRCRQPMHWWCEGRRGWKTHRWQTTGVPSAPSSSFPISARVFWEAQWKRCTGVTPTGQYAPAAGQRWTCETRFALFGCTKVVMRALLTLPVATFPCWKQPRELKHSTNTGANTADRSWFRDQVSWTLTCLNNDKLSQDVFPKCIYLSWDINDTTVFFFKYIFYYTILF